MTFIFIIRSPKQKINCYMLVIKMSVITAKIVNLHESLSKFQYAINCQHDIFFITIWLSIFNLIKLRNNFILSKNMIQQ